MTLPRYLDQHCVLCGQKHVRYVKTKGGFHKCCDRCIKMLEGFGKSSMVQRTEKEVVDGYIRRLL